MTAPQVTVDDNQPPPPDETSGPEFDDRAGPREVLAAVATVIGVFAAIALSFRYVLKDDDMAKGIRVVVAIALGAVGVWALFWAFDRLVSALPRVWANRLRPVVFVGPAMAFLGLFLVYPAVNTLLLSFQDQRSDNWIGFDNYERVLTESQYQLGIRNSVIWVLVVPFAAVAIGLAFATMADKLGKRAEATTKSLLFMPMAISFVGASVVFTFIYAFRPEGFGEQIGVLNGIWTNIGGDPVNWLAQKPWNNLYLMVILIWLQTGFSMVILSSAIKSVPDELLEAARIDGATEWQVFWRITFPTIASTIVVVWTTVLITVWKVFDIVWVMTGGRDDTQVIAQQMVQEFFTNRDNGVGATLAVLLFIAVLPILVINIRRFKAQEAIR